MIMIESNWVYVLVPVPRAAEAKTGTSTCYRVLLSLEEVSVGENRYGVEQKGKESRQTQCRSNPCDGVEASQAVVARVLEKSNPAELLGSP